MRIFEVMKISTGGDKNLTDFMTEFREQTQRNPFLPRMGIWKESIGLEVSPFAGRIHLSSIMSFMKKNAGDASAALKWLCALADKHQVTLELMVKPIKNAGAREGKNLNKAQLTAWYKRNGFVKGNGFDHMERPPKSSEK